MASAQRSAKSGAAGRRRRSPRATRPIGTCTPKTRISTIKPLLRASNDAWVRVVGRGGKTVGRVTSACMARAVYLLGLPLSIVRADAVMACWDPLSQP
jgi:hypothetical protein